MRLTRRGRIVAAAAVVLLVIGAIALVYGYAVSIGLAGDSAPGDAVEVEIPKGATADEVGRILEREGVIRSAFGFRVAVYLKGGGAQIQAGTYELLQGLTAGDALASLRDGPEMKFVTVTFPEGSWLTDFADIVERDTHINGKEFLELATSGNVRSRYQKDDVDTVEGLVFPSTYQVIRRDTAETLLQRLVGEFDKHAGRLDFTRVRAMGISPYEAITVASMIEAETKISEERPMVAAVIYNRLKEGIPLGIDATVLYALGEHKEVLTRSDLEVDSPYNTRIHTGLPPTPIGAPGFASLEAAVEPAEGSWLYYVLADCEGNHAFSTSYDEFLADKAAYQALEC